MLSLSIKNISIAKQESDYYLQAFLL